MKNRQKVQSLMNWLPFFRYYLILKKKEGGFLRESIPGETSSDFH
ncbi:hypothetical protein [Cyclobacterium jeungdonense]|uniref:Uncharacterized protein n=1 Tax=Cyclobacterium jeungdonense TaxID=708087 RepID=A0ABT8CBQ7_9BACT|nr:hypothetical protein [Cyclobacterium jeungdonense]MDN3690249.1 hypothetical protein [Cyclobacterium jeungdonense]